MGWSTFKLPVPPTAVTAAIEGIETMAEASAAAFDQARGVVEAFAALPSSQLTATQQLLAGAVTSVSAALESLTNDTGIYVLIVPPARKPVIPAGVTAVLSSQFIADVTPEKLNVQASFDGDAVTSTEHQILNGLFTASSGTGGFVRTVIESLDDLRDPNRPQLSDTDAVAGLYVVAGASSISAVMPFLSNVSAFFLPQQPYSLTPPEIPVPQGLSARIIAGPGVFLRWKFQDPYVELPTYSTYAMVSEVAVIRATSVEMLGQTDVISVFGSSSLSAGVASPDGKTVVVAVIPHATGEEVTNFTDYTALPPGTAAYYAISYRVKLGTLDELQTGGGVDQGYTRLSNVVKVSASRRDHPVPRSTEGLPPDWYRTPRSVDLIPALGLLLNRLNSAVTQFSDSATGYAAMLRAQISALELQVAAYTELAASLTSSLASLKALAGGNLGTASVRPFSGVGGNRFLKKDLVKAFGDTSDPNMPVFGAEDFVTGVVLLATTPAAEALLSLLFGAGASASDTLASALERIDVELRAVETVAFASDLTPTALAQATSVLTVPQIGETSSYCYQPYNSDAVFDDSLNPRSDGDA